MANKLKKRHDDIFDKRNEHLEKISQHWRLPFDYLNSNKIMVEKFVSCTTYVDVRTLYNKNSVSEITKKMSFGCNSVTQTFLLGKIDNYTYPENSSDFMIDKNI